MVDDQVHFPDVRIEYERPDGERKVEVAEKTSAQDESTAVEEAPIEASEGAVIRPIEMVAKPTAKNADAMANATPTMKRRVAKK